MTTFAYDGPDGAVNDHDTAQPQLPGRPRRRLLTKSSVALLSLLLGGVGFLVGIKVEKGEQTGSSSVASAPAAASSATAGRATGGTTASGTGARAAGASQSSTAGAGVAPAGVGAPGTPDAAGGGTAGTVSSVSGKTIYLKTSSGAVVKVRLSSATKVAKDLTVSSGSLHPGDTIAVTGITGSNGSIKAAAVADSGDSSTSSSSSSGSSASSS